MARNEVVVCVSLKTKWCNETGALAILMMFQINLQKFALHTSTARRVHITSKRLPRNASYARLAQTSSSCYNAQTIVLRRIYLFKSRTSGDTSVTMFASAMCISKSHTHTQTHTHMFAGELKSRVA